MYALEIESCNVMLHWHRHKIHEYGHCEYEKINVDKSTIRIFFVYVIQRISTIEFFGF